MFRSKKAQKEIYFFMIQILLLAILIFSLLAYLRSVEKNTFLEKKFLARDIAFVTNILYASPGNIYYEYYPEKIDLLKFGFEFKDQLINVKDSGVQKEVIRFPYTNNLFFIPLINPVSISDKIEFENSGYFFKIKNKLTPNLKKLKYPLIDTSGKIDSKTIVIDPVSIQKTENKLVTVLTEHKDYNYKSKGQNTPPLDIYLYIFQNTSKNQIRKKDIKAKIKSTNALKSRKLASIIINRLIDRNPDLERAYIIIDDNEENLAQAEQASVLIEIGSGLTLHYTDIHNSFVDYFAK